MLTRCGHMFSMPPHLGHPRLLTADGVRQIAIELEEIVRSRGFYKETPQQSGQAGIAFEEFGMGFEIVAETLNVVFVKVVGDCAELIGTRLRD